MYRASPSKPPADAVAARAVREDLAAQGPLAERSWGERNVARICHPLSRALPGFLAARLNEAGVTRIEDLAVCTYADAGYFSYRRTTHRGEPDYGRNLSAIALAPEPAP